jgi:hypothetical protein
MDRLAEIQKQSTCGMKESIILMPSTQVLAVRFKTNLCRRLAKMCSANHIGLPNCGKFPLLL